MAAMASGRREHLENANALLAQLAHREGQTMYWTLEANTSPFHGWGSAGRVETTALAVEALALYNAGRRDPETDDRIGRGLQFLLTHKDRYAVWYSTQATQNVVEAMIVAMPPAAETARAPEASLIVNGRMVRKIQFPNPNEATGPIAVSIENYIEKGNNKIEIVRSESAAAMNASLITSYYLPWADSQATNEENFRSGPTRALRLKAGFDHNSGKPGDRIHCSVEVERIGFQGYGMMLAEIGLPPGAEVDRASLEESGSYEVQPDRIVFYLWPQAGGTKLGFDFRLRYRMEAMTAPSRVYDYYNPEESATVAPVRFTVR